MRATHEHDRRIAGRNKGVVIVCPKCPTDIALAVSGCAACIQYAALDFARHLVAEHPKFITDVKTEAAL
jgi:hypothetical protein